MNRIPPAAFNALEGRLSRAQAEWIEACRIYQRAAKNHFPWAAAYHEMEELEDEITNIRKILSN